MGSFNDQCKDVNIYAFVMPEILFTSDVGSNHLADHEIYEKKYLIMDDFS